jgi:hypothetical protein
MKLLIYLKVLEILTIMKVLTKTTRGLVHLQLFRPSVIRGPWSMVSRKYHKKSFEHFFDKNLKIVFEKCVAN